MASTFGLPLGDGALLSGRPLVRFQSGVPECVDERCSTENSARKCGVFTYLLAFSLKKVRKTGFIKKSVFLRNRRHFRDAAGRFYELV